MRRLRKGPRPLIYVIGLREQRVERGWSYADLAEHLGTARSYPEKLEGGQKPSLETLLDLAEVLGQVVVTNGDKCFVVMELPTPPAARPGESPQRPPDP